VASTKFVKRDLNRYRRIYPYIRRAPHWALISDKEAMIEVGAIDFNNAHQGSYTFLESFPGIPMLTGISYDSETNLSADVNVFITALSSTSVTFETSNDFTGQVHFHAVWVSP